MNGGVKNRVSGVLLVLGMTAGVAAQAATVPALSTAGPASDQNAAFQPADNPFSRATRLMYLASQGQPHKPASQEAAEPPQTPEEKAAKEEHRRQEQQTGQHKGQQHPMPPGMEHKAPDNPGAAPTD